MSEPINPAYELSYWGRVYRQRIAEFDDEGMEQFTDPKACTALKRIDYWSKRLMQEQEFDPLYRAPKQPTT